MRYRSTYGHPMLAATAAPTVVELKALAVIDHMPNEVIQLSDGRLVQYKPESVLPGDDVFVFEPDEAQPGRYVLAHGFETDLPLPFTFETLNGAVLATVPPGAAMLVRRGYWSVGEAMVGPGTLGLSSSQLPYDAPGDLHGGALGDDAATLVADTVIAGTPGVALTEGVILLGGAELRLDVMGGAMTAGAGIAHLVGFLLANPG